MGFAEFIIGRAFARPVGSTHPTEGRRYGSTRRLATAGDADLFPEVVETDRADHHLLADHVARRAVHAHRFGDLVGWVERRETHHPACQRSPKLRVSSQLSP